MKLKYYTNCVNWPQNDVHAEVGLCDMISEERNVSRRTFLQHVDRDDERDIERQFGYAPHDRSAVLRMSKDYHVSYHRSRLHGKRVYFIKHSAIEYVFA